jgi:hypothetical protein
MRAQTAAARGLLIVHSVLLSAASASAQSFKEWRRQADVRVPAGRFVAITLAPEVFDGCEKLDLSDLRLADPRGTEVPYALVREKEVREEVELDGQVLNRESPTPETSRLTVDFGSSVVKNRITVTTEGDSFRRRVRVEGSADQGAWAEVLPGGWLHAVGAGQRFETIDIGANTYRFLRITVSRMPEETRAPAIESVRCRHVVVRQPEETVREARLESYVTVAAAHESTAHADFGLRHLPIARLRLLLGSDPQRVFRRPCQVYGRNSLEHEVEVRFESDERAGTRRMETPLQHVGTGTIFRDAAGRESLELPVAAPYRYVRIVIENGDSPPLEVSGVEGVLHPVHAIFEPAGQSRLVLHCGNPDALPPSYEAAGTLAALDVRGLPRGDIAALVAQAEAQKPEAKAGQTAVWVCLGAMVAATLALLWWTAVAQRKGEEKAEPPS